MCFIYEVFHFRETKYSTQTLSTLPYSVYIILKHSSLLCHANRRIILQVPQKFGTTFKRKGKNPHIRV